MKLRKTKPTQVSGIFFQTLPYIGVIHPDN